MGSAAVALGRGPGPSHRAHEAPQAHARAALRSGRALRPVRRPARNEQHFRNIKSKSGIGADDQEPPGRRNPAAFPGRHGMKITNVRAHVLRSALAQPFAFSQGWVSSRGATLVELETDEGVTGWGEALCQGLQPPEIAAAAVEYSLKHLVLGKNPLEPEVLWHRMYHHTRDYGQKGAVIGAISGIDIALWDIAGKVRREPVAKLLGGMFRTRVEAYATGFYRIKGHGEAARLAREFETHVGSGFRALKIKLGFGIADDLAVMKQLKQIEKNNDVMIDV